MFELRTGHTNSARKIDWLTRRGIRVYSVSRGKVLKLRLDARGARVAKDEFLDAKILPVGISALLKILTRWYTVLGTALAVLFLYCFSLFTLGCQVVGADEYTAPLCTYLEERGYSGLRFKGTTDTEQLENDILHAFPFSIVSVSTKGSYLTVLVKEELPPQSLAPVEPQTAVVATYSGVITRVIATSGTPLVRRGQAVRRGDVLIDNAIMVGEERVAMRAEGTVYAKVVFSQRATVGKTALVWQRSGVSHTASYVDVGGHYVMPVSPYEHFEVESERVRTGDFLPIYAVYLTFFELVPCEVESDFEREVDRVKAELYQELVQKLPDSATEIDYFCTEKEILGRIEVCACLEAEIIISEHAKAGN